MTNDKEPVIIDNDNLDAFDALYLKYEFDGVTTLAGLAEALRNLANEVESRADQGWDLAAPIDGGWAHLKPNTKDSETAKKMVRDSMRATVKGLIAKLNVTTSEQELDEWTDEGTDWFLSNTRLRNK